MRIAFATNGEDLKAEVALHFGRAKNFLIYDAKTESFGIFPNPEVAGGKEFPPDFLYHQGVKAVIVFGLGAMAYKKFKDYNIKMHKAIEGSILENIKKLEKGNLGGLKKEDIF